MDNYNTYTDSELFTLMKGGDNNAFVEMYERYWAVLYRHAVRISKDNDIAQDVVQDVFVGLWDCKSSAKSGHDILES